MPAPKAPRTTTAPVIEQKTLQAKPKQKQLTILEEQQLKYAGKKAGSNKSKIKTKAEDREALQLQKMRAFQNKLNSTNDSRNDADDDDHSSNNDNDNNNNNNNWMTHKLKSSESISD